MADVSVSPEVGGRRRWRMLVSRLVSRGSDDISVVALRWIPALVVAGLIFAGSSLQSEQISRVPIRIPDKIAHAVEYSVLGAALLFALAPAHVAAKPRTVLHAVAIAIGFGVTDEIHQAFVPTRDVSAADLLADAVGAVAGSWALWWIGMTGWRR